MYLVHLTLLHAVVCLEIQVQGDVAFDVRVFNGGRDKQKWFRQEWKVDNQEQTLVFKMMQERQNVTVAPEVECTYQYPEKEQVNAVLSNMMNELTKVFVRANDFISGVETRRGGRRQKARAKDTKDARQRILRRVVDNRFEVVKTKQKAFFELIYANMTNDYRHFYNATAERVDRSGRDPCQHQDEVKQIWRDLLEHAHRTLNAAAHRCVDEYLHDQHVEPNSKVRARLEHYLIKELSKVRAGQLQMLCDTYQLCYNDLL